jgi:hypothetical protein
MPRALLLGLLLFGCQSPTTVQRCGEIPGGGCPLGRGGTCADLECDALYDCLDGSWRLTQVCDPGTGGEGAGGDGAGGGAGGGCEGVVIDDPGGTGCTPDLQEPDCPAAAAAACHPCLTGCADFFVCAARGWEAVAFCDEDGHVVLEP